MKLTFIQPRPELKAYINKLWLFESNCTLVQDISLVAPNAKAKIIIPFSNALTTTHNGKTTICRENDICFIGIRDVPVTISTEPGASRSIGVELTTAGAYRFLDMPMHVLTNNLFSFADLYDKKGNHLLRKMADEGDPIQKLAIIQDFLLKRLLETERNNSIIDYSVSMITSLHGLMEIKELQRKTGYSKRYLDMLFKEHLGISPKTLATIMRFQRFYKQWDTNTTAFTARETMYELYYDQSHFIKEFKRYTGHTPMQYMRLRNDFGKNF